ncbi:hypothetical protein JYU34_009146 [Plutella xylostella]|uniref:E3 ubiquitin-protein ligase CHFR n=1 Tax=Plutella xylostella TaxID=51655 RepID=A0ABQ7QN86_PLUXY|nr:hypothetical protein JYU34_009146 [Plutella xylostella]
MQENYPTLVSVKSLKSEFEKFHKIQITSTEFTIGRSLDNNVVIAFLAISRKHCVFTKINEVDWGIEDFSSFGIEVNGTKLKKGCKFRLSDNDIIQLDATGDFLYKFVSPGEEHCTPRKRIKLEENSCSTSSCHPDIINNVKLKFEESQNFEINHIKEKIETAKQMQTTSMILKQQLELDMARRVETLEQGFAAQIENLRGEKDEVERQKQVLEAERDLQLASVKEQMEEKITELMNQIQKHNETESELVKENTALKEKLLKEREDFLSELHRENSSKQDLLEQLEAKMREQEEMRLKEKQELEVVLRNETEQLRLAKEKELSELEEQKRLREQELQQELSKMQAALHDQLSRTEAERARLQRELADKAEQVTRLNAQEQKKMELLLEERAEAEKKLQEAQVQSEKTLEELRERVSTRETELAALAAARIQQQADQSGQVISSLQQQLENVRSQLQSVEIEKNTLLQNICSSDPGEGSSKQEALEEVGELLQSELQCSICTELLVAATTLNCSHTYCKYCITVWGKKKRECPICRAPITSECRSLVLDSFIEKMVASLSAELQEKRRELLKDREEMDAELARGIFACSRRRRSDSSEPPSSRSDDDDGDSLEEEETDYSYPRYGRYNSSYDDGDGGSDSSADSDVAASVARARAIGAVEPTGEEPRARSPLPAGTPRRRGRVAGLPNAYYGGYGRCYRCGARGHWAPGCPF